MWEMLTNGPAAELVTMGEGHERGPRFDVLSQFVLLCTYQWVDRLVLVEVMAGSSTVN